jgi:hypothetical protein
MRDRYGIKNHELMFDVAADLPSHGKNIGF